MAIYFTSDLHLGDESIVWTRPMFTDVHDMTNAIIHNWNSVVKDNDTVFILGDLIHGVTWDKVSYYLNALGGEKILILGNHDREHSKGYYSVEHWVNFLRGEPSTKLKSVFDYELLKIDDVHKFTLFHYPIEFWEGRDKGTIHLHGHMHGSVVNNIHNAISDTNKYDVGVDANEFTPVSLEQILKFLNKDFSHLKQKYYR